MRDTFAESGNKSPTSHKYRKSGRNKACKSRRYKKILPQVEMQQSVDVKNYGEKQK